MNAAQRLGSDVSPRGEGRRWPHGASLVGDMNISFLPTSRKVLPTVQTFCPDGVQIAQTVIHFEPLSSSGQEKGCFGVGSGGVLCMYISPKRGCDGSVKNRGCRWYSGKNEIHLGNVYEKWAKVL